MSPANGPGQIVILNGAPRAGKSSIVAAIQATFDGPWLNLGVDVLNQQVTPPRYRPGIGLRPGGERPDLEPYVVAQFAALYEAIAAHSRQGLNVVVDVGHHDSYSRPLGILPDSARRLRGLRALFVGVRCPIEEIMRRRNAGQPGRERTYLTGPPEQPPAPVLLWQSAVHTPGIYDLEVDTSLLSPEQCAALILQRLRDGPLASALDRLAAGETA